MSMYTSMYVYYLINVEIYYKLALHILINMPIIHIQIIKIYYKIYLSLNIT